MLVFSVQRSYEQNLGFQGVYINSRIQSFLNKNISLIMLTLLLDSSLPFAVTVLGGESFNA
jgi:hypothetical protein